MTHQQAHHVHIPPFPGFWIGFSSMRSAAACRMTSVRALLHQGCYWTMRNGGTSANVSNTRCIELYCCKCFRISAFKVHSSILLELWLAAATVRELLRLASIPQKVGFASLQQPLASAAHTRVFCLRCPPTSSIDGSDGANLLDEAVLPESPILKEASVKLPPVGL